MKFLLTILFLLITIQVQAAGRFVGGVWVNDAELGAGGLTGLSDIGVVNVSAGKILIADGTKYQSVSMSSDCTIASSGATSCTGARPGNASINHAVCWKNGTTSLGYCSSAVGIDGTCTCS